MPSSAEFGVRGTLRRASLNCVLVSLALLLLFLITAQPVQADTITIEPGSAAGPNTFGDQYVQTQLASGHFTLDTSDGSQANGGGPDEIHIEPGVTITWTSPYSLTLLAGADILITGTVQHDGPANGAGGIRLAAGGDVQLGDGTQPDAIAVGSRHGLTRVDGANVRLLAGDDSGTNRFVLLGYRAIDQGATYTVTGPISVTAAISVTGLGGDEDFNFVQIGHGGAELVLPNTLVDGDFSGDITIVAGEFHFEGGQEIRAYALVGNGGSFSRGDRSGNHSIYAQNITIQGGQYNFAYAQVGNGGYYTSGVFTGTVTLSATQAISVLGGLWQAYAQVGNGGYGADGNIGGDHTVRSQTGDIVFQAGIYEAYVLMGNGGYASGSYFSGSNHSGNHTVATQDGDVIVRAGNGEWSYALVGNGGSELYGDQTGNHSVSSVNGDILFQGGIGGSVSFAMVGNGGYEVQGNHNGSHSVTTQHGNIEFLGGSASTAWAQVGNGGYDADGNHSGSQTVSTQDGDITFRGGTSARSYAQVGNGGDDAEGNQSGSITVTATTGDVVFTAGQAFGVYAQVGNGGFGAHGDHDGDHTLSAGGTISFTAGIGNYAYAQVGNGGSVAHGSHSGDVQVTSSGGDISFTAGIGNYAYAQVGNGGYDVEGDLSGQISVTATSGNVVFTGGSAHYTYAHLGHGGGSTEGDLSGDHTVTAGDIISFTAGAGRYSYTQVGNGGQYPYGIISGSHTLNAGGDIRFAGGSFVDGYALVGNGGMRFGWVSVSGDHHVTSHNGDIVFWGGNGEAASAQIGNSSVPGFGSLSGNHDVRALNGNIIFQAHAGQRAYAKVGNGSDVTFNTVGGDHTLYASQSITFAAGSSYGAYAVVGNGSQTGDGGTTSGNMTVTAQSGHITFLAGSADWAFAKIGNGTRYDQSQVSGNNLVRALNGDITFRAGSAYGTNVQVGSAGDDHYPQHGDATVYAPQGTVTFLAGDGWTASAQVGNGGYYSAPSDGNHTIIADTVHFAAGAGDEAYAQVGNGGTVESGNMSGTVTISATHNISFSAGGGQRAYAHVGNGSSGYAYGNHSGDVVITAEGSATFSAGSGVDAHALVGHGGTVAGGTRSGDITLVLGDDLVLHGAHIGHITMNGVGAITDANTYIAVSQNNPLANGTGVIHATNTPTFTVGFNSAPLTNSGELRFYVPLASSASIPANAPMNSELFPGSVPANRMAGFHFFADGPYIQDYSFYLGPVPDVGLTKTVQPSGTLLPGQPLAYTLTFSNSGSYTATAVVLTDTLPSQLFNIDLATVLEPGVILTPTGSAPNLAWQISDLAPGQGGTITITTQVAPALSAPVSFTNTAGIATSLDLMQANNSALATSSVIVPRVGFSPTTYAVWEDSGSVVLTLALDMPNPYATTSVAYASTDGTAQAGSDYSAVNDTLSFAPGQTVATVTVPIVADFVEEADETFSVAISNPTGAALGAATTATVTLRNDDVTPALAASKQANVSLARVGEPITYTYRITNTGALTFTALHVVDDRLGAVPLDKSSLGLGEVATGQLVHTIVMNDLPGPLVNTVTVTGTPQVGNVVTASATTHVDLVQAAFSFSKTVGIVGIQPECTAASTMQVPISTTVVYCYSVTNTGTETLTPHTLIDDQLGTILDGVAFDLAPGASYSTTVTRTLYTSVTNVATWQAGYAGSADATGSVSIAALPTQNTTQATVIISDDAADQDSDGIPDNVEQAGDIDQDNVPSFLDDDSDGDGRLDRDECPGLPCRDSDNDGTPDFLDPDQPTGLNPDDQPLPREFIYLPTIMQPAGVQE